MPNNNVAILSIMSKFDEKSAREAANRANKVYDEALSDIGNVNFDKKLLENFDKAMNLLKNKFKKVNLSSYTNNLLDSIFSDKDISEKSKDIESFIKKIDLLKKASSGQDINAFNTFSAKQIEALISRTEKLAQKQDEINEKTREYNREATKIAKTNRSISTIDKNYGNQDYTKTLESLKKSLGTEKEFTDEQNQSIENLAKMVNLYQVMEKSEPQKGTAEAIRYSKDLLAVTQKIKEERDKIDAFSQKGASAYINNNGLSSIDKVSDYTVNKAKDDFTKASLSNLKAQEAKLQSELTTYISDSVQKNLAKVSKEADAVIDKAEKRVENLQNKIDSLQSKPANTGTDNSLIGNIVSESDVKSLEEIENRLMDINELDADGNAKNKDLKEYIQLYKEYLSMVKNPDKYLEREYNDIIERSDSLKKYADTLDETISKQETLFSAESNNNTDIEERTEQLIKQEEQAKETAKSEEELAKSQSEFGNSNLYSTLQSDINEIKTGISEIKETISSLDNIDSFEQISSQIKDATRNIDILKEKLTILFDSFKSNKKIDALDVLMHGGNLDIIQTSEYKRSDALLKNMQNIFSGSGSDYGMVTGGGIFGLNDMSGIDKTDVNSNAKWYAIDYSKYHTYMVETEQEAEELNQFMQHLNLMVVKNLGVDGKYIAPSFQDMYKDVNIENLFSEYQSSFKGANLSLDEFKSVINDISERIQKAGFELYDDDEYSYTGKNAKVSSEHAYDDDISTMFYKKHGYQGFNAQKLTNSDYNSYVYGSTIFDIDKENPYFKVFETYEDAVKYMEQIREKIDTNQKVSYEYIEKSSNKYKDDLIEVNNLLQEQSKLIDEINRKLSNQTDSDITKQENKSNISSENPTVEVSQNDEVTASIRKKKEELASYELQLEETRYEIEKLSKVENESFGFNRSHTKKEQISSLRDSVARNIFGKPDNGGRSGQKKWFALGDISNIDSSVLKSYQMWNEELSKAGYKLSEIRAIGKDGLEADIIPIDGKAITNAEEFRKALDNITTAPSENVELLNKQVSELESKISSLKAEIASLQSNQNSPMKDVFQGDEASKINEVVEATNNLADAENRLNIVEDKKSAQKYWQGRFKDSISDMTKTNDELVKMNKYYSDLEKMSEKLVSAQNKVDNANIDIDKLSKRDVQSDNYIKAIENYKNSITELQNYIKLLNNNGIQSQDDIDELNRLQKAVDEVSKSIKNMSASEKGTNIAKSSTVFLKIEELRDKYKGMSKDMQKELDRLERKFAGLGDTIDTGRAIGELKQFETQLIKTGTATNSLWSAMKDKAFYNFANQLGTMVSFYDLISLGREGFQTIRELDTALTEMKKVSDETTQSLKNYQAITFDVGDAVGATAKTIQESTADWMRLGESINEAAESAKASNILLNVSEFESIDEATESLVAMSQAYSELGKMDIIDVLNNIGNNYSIATDGLATALQKSASALKTANNDLNSAVALATAGNAVVQDPDSVGAGIRTISLRLVGTEAAKQELESIGEETDDVITTTSKLRDTILSATAAATNDGKGFDIFDSNGNYKSTYEIMQGLADLYDDIVAKDKELGTNNLNLLLETIAGKNRSNIAASILQNGEMLRSVYQDAQNSSGSAQKELDSYLDSIDGRMTQLENRAQEFWYKVIDSDTIKNGITLLTKLLELGTNIVDTFGGLSTILSAGSGIALNKMLG